MKKADYSKEIRNEAFKIWLGLHQSETKVLGKIISYTTIAVGIILVILAACLSIGINLPGWITIAEANQWRYVFVGLLACFLGSLMLINVLGVVDYKNWAAKLQKICHKHYKFIFLATDNLGQKYKELAQRWSIGGDKNTLFDYLAGDFRGFLFVGLNDFSVYKEHAADLIQSQMEIALERLEEIKNVLDISDQYFCNPQEISGQINKINSLIWSYRPNLTEQERQILIKKIVFEFDNLETLAAKIPELIQTRDLIYEGPITGGYAYVT